MDYTHQEEIECRCFDDEFEIAGETLFIKIDVEQFEAEALRGMQTLFEKNQILLIVEINTPNSEAFQILKSFGMMQILCMGEDYVFTNFDYEKVSGLC